MPTGYVYIFNNASMPGKLKIGYTTRKPEERASELRTTGVPHPFAVVHYEALDKCYEEAEREIHERLSEYRCSNDREFFNLSAAQAIVVVAEIAKRYRQRTAKEKAPPVSDSSKKDFPHSREREAKEKAPPVSDTPKEDFSRRNDDLLNVRKAKKPDFYTTRQQDMACLHCGTRYSVTLRRSEDMSVCPSCFKGSNQPVGELLPKATEKKTVRPDIRKMQDIVIADLEHLNPRIEPLTGTIAILGLGGAGCNMINGLVLQAGMSERLISADTWEQAITASPVQRTILLSKSITNGAGAGGKAMIGEAGTQSDLPKLLAAIGDADNVIIIAGMGGGTGGGGSKALIPALVGKRVVLMAIMPFQFEGIPRHLAAEEALAVHINHGVETIIIKNQDVFKLADDRTTFADAFKILDKAVVEAVKSKLVLSMAA